MIGGSSKVFFSNVSETRSADLFPFPFHHEPYWKPVSHGVRKLEPTLTQHWSYRYYLHRSELFNDIRAIPLVVAAISLALIFVHVLFCGIRSCINPAKAERGASQDRDTHPQPLSEQLKAHIRFFGGYTIFGFMLARLVGSMTLFYLSTVTLRLCEIIRFGKCPEAFFIIPFVSVPRIVFDHWRLTLTIELCCSLRLHLHRFTGLEHPCNRRQPFHPLFCPWGLCIPWLVATREVQRTPSRYRWRQCALD